MKKLRYLIAFATCAVSLSATPCFSVEPDDQETPDLLEQSMTTKNKQSTEGQIQLDTAEKLYEEDIAQERPDPLLSNKMSSKKTVSSKSSRKTKAKEKLKKGSDDLITADPLLEGISDD